MQLLRSTRRNGWPVAAGIVSATAVAMTLLHATSAVAESTTQLTIDTIDRDGNPSGYTAMRVVGLDNDVMLMDTTTDATWTTELQAGRYHVDVMIYTPTETQDSVSIHIQPELVVTEDVAVEYDAGEAEPISIDLPRPDLEPDAVIIGFDRGLKPITFGDTLTHSSFDLIYTKLHGRPAENEPLNTLFAGIWRDTTSDSTDTFRIALPESGFPTGYRASLSTEDFTTVEARYRAQNDNDWGEKEWIAIYSNTAIGLSADIQLPTNQIEHLNITEDVTWKPEFHQLRETEEEVVSESTEQGEPIGYHARQTYQELWNAGPFGPAFSAEGSAVARWDDTLSVDIPMFSAAGEGRTGRSEFTTGHTRLYRGTDLIGETDEPGVATVEGLPDGPEEYRLSIEADRTDVSPFSTKVHSDWTFTSAAGEESPSLPAVRYSPRGLDDRNHARPGRPITVDVSVIDTTGSLVAPASLTIEASFDGGRTWTELDVHRNRVMVRPGWDTETVDLRAVASDDDGNQVEQTIFDAIRIA
ncbi:hypothetical protein FB566_5039 [Stackebrandtia endophytica]|uniref:Carboxypeptidase family protein n=1 Tax=Stackebrandtia endophytica TaxID=1496996 RepID=A0A543B3R2_9ACTN|nr:hypothetical protein [Stackebrandtia endophytica]TQL79433.1 hypothetical protein FB566_5039 [Stackebrandtia endophytica]